MMVNKIRHATAMVATFLGMFVFWVALIFGMAVLARMFSGG